VDCELQFDAVTFQRTRRGERQLLGEGSFGNVYAAAFGDQPCVVKVPKAHGDVIPAAVVKVPKAHGDVIPAAVVEVPKAHADVIPAAVVDAFWAEVRTQFAFRHPHIVALHGGYADVDPAAGGVVEVGAVMERCSGGTLEKRLHGAGAAPGPLKQRLAWAAQVLSALAYLHAKDFIHADLKPENVLLDARAKLADFGLAKQRADSLASSTAVGSTYRKERGTPLYMDPRLMVAMTGARVAEADAGSLRKASDVYSAGVLLWELATGRVPFVDSLGGGSLAGVTKEGLYAFAVGGGRPATPAELAALVPAGLGALIGRMWAARAEDRPTIVAAGEELARLAAGMVGDA
jgi:serine/threonine protein kinase